MWYNVLWTCYKDLFMGENFVTVFNNDCIQSLKEIYNQNLVSQSPLNPSCVIADPPYALNHGQKPIKFKSRKEIVTNFGGWDLFDDKSYSAFSESWLLGCNRIMLDGANIVVFTPLEKIGFFINLFPACGFKYQQTMIWHKTNPTPRIRKTGFLSSCEGIVWGYKANLDKTRPLFNFTKQNEMHNFIQTPIVQGKVRTKHPTQKPTAITDKLINVLSNEGDLILDPFLGSGTTAASCINLKRNCVGIENDESYIEIANNRILDINKKLTEPYRLIWLKNPTVTI